MGKPATGIAWRDREKGLSNSLLQGFWRTHSYPPSHGFEFGERLFNR